MMYWIGIINFLLIVTLPNNALDHTVSLKKFSKIHQNTKYLIVETIDQNGIIENVITSVSLNDLKTAKNQQSLKSSCQNIDWDENPLIEGLQMTAKDVTSIENAFNNAIAQTEKNSNLKTGSMQRLKLERNFLSLSNKDQSIEIINSLIESFSSLKEFQDIKSTSKNEALQDAYLFTTENEKISIPHIRTIYNWVFADQYSGWTNRDAILSMKMLSGNETRTNIDEDFHENLEIMIVLEEVVANPTFLFGTYLKFDFFQNGGAIGLEVSNQAIKKLEASSIVSHQ